MCLVDTNVISELRKKESGDARDRDWYATVDTRTIYLSVLVLGEIRAGAERIREREPRKAADLDGWLSQVIERHQRRILAIDYEVAGSGDG
jgi:toxin FitB